MVKHYLSFRAPSLTTRLSKLCRWNAPFDHCPNISAGALKTLVEIRNEALSQDEDPEHCELSITGLSVDDRKWFEANVDQLEWNTTQAPLCSSRRDGIHAVNTFVSSYVRKNIVYLPIFF